MKLSVGSVILVLALITLGGCAGADGAGYWFHIIFVLIPLIIIGALLWRYSESTSESLFIIEGQLRRLSNRIEELEEKIATSGNKNKNKSKKPKKQKEEKTPEESPREEETKD